MCALRILLTISIWGLCSSVLCFPSFAVCAGCGGGFTLQFVQECLSSLSYFLWGWGGCCCPSSTAGGGSSNRLTYIHITPICTNIGQTKEVIVTFLAPLSFVQFSNIIFHILRRKSSIIVISDISQLPTIWTPTIASYWCFTAQRWHTIILFDIYQFLLV